MFARSSQANSLFDASYDPYRGGMELLFSSIPSRKLSLPKTYDPRMLGTRPGPTSTTKTSPEEGGTNPSPSTSTSMDQVEEVVIGSEGMAKTDLRYLIWYLRWKLLDDPNRSELFSIGESVRPGILVLINSTDWELEGELEYEIEDGDEIVFISTLHGG
ncbi:BQ2448_5512 [Microbotryum intermedium]|uniref:Ubiquitin-related modifier 1 n=1 Tax=Microbotryum intermedium TaxID=269621 RepID=A0A238F749_9BASI|nr:BQ2448_5512 [Microbotryum intermedium]